MDAQMAVLAASAAVVLGVMAVGCYLVVRDTVRRTGKWGINLDPASVRCPGCGRRSPVVRRPRNSRQALWGGYTCDECGVEIDKWGREVAP